MKKLILYGMIMLLCITFTTAIPTDYAAYFPLDNGNANSTSGNMIATISGATNVTAGCISNGCYSFDGNDVITYSNNSFVNGQSALTICAMANSGNTGVFNPFLGFDTNTHAFFAFDGANKRVRYYVGGIESQAFTGTSYLANTWFYICARYNGTAVAAYENGTFKAASAITGVTTHNTFRLGDRGDTGAAFTGLLDEITVYLRALNDSEILELYQNDGVPTAAATTPVLTVNYPPNASGIGSGTSVTYNVTTDIVASVWYSNESITCGQGTFMSTSDGTNHTSTESPLNNNQGYTRYFVANNSNSCSEQTIIQFGMCANESYNATDNTCTVQNFQVNVTLINLTSEGGAGQIIFYNVTATDNKQTPPFAKTVDLTPTYRFETNVNADCALINSNLDLNYSDIVALNANYTCATTGGTQHICTLPNENAISTYGLNNFSLGCRNEAGKENLSSTSGKFLTNFTAAPSASNVFIQPIPLYEVTDAMGFYTYNDVDGGSNMSQLDWLLNGSAISAYQNISTLPSTEFSTGDNITFCVTPYDGEFFGEQNCTGGTFVVAATTTDNFCAGGPSSLFFNPNINNFNFTDLTLTQLNVLANGTSSSICLFNTTTSVPENLTVTMYLNYTAPNITLKCNDAYDNTTASAIGLSPVSIATVNNETSAQIWCWADYNKATGGGEDFNLTIDFLAIP